LLMNKPPKTVRILGFDYQVVFEPQQIWDGKEYAWGMCDNEKQTIQIWDGLTLQRKRQVFLHEVIHAIFELMAVAQGNEENVCDCVSLGLMAVMRDNHDWLTWMTE
jgi:hypothetical protein